MSDEAQIVDLDALAPRPVTVKFNDTEIQIHPPKVADFLRLGYLGQKLEGASDLTDEQLGSLITDMTALIGKMVPELSGEQLNSAQLLKLNRS